ncbi:hypothetical protein P3X46_000468 [Hevea brasiliensis]|uniref:Transposase, Ptta/En/Spm, plant n=1 Tax=Hevea brasiliensis TaxID=3981 RepID=A0ABQ9NA20_HEVBR|nr:hypothetical protein P3X46_000468 [Hevea brasiliensis]
MRGNGRRGGLLGHSQSRQLPVQDEPNDQLDQSTQGQPQVPSRSTGRSAPDPEGSTASTQHRAIPPPPPPPPITPSSEPAIGSTSGHEGHSVGAAPISSMDGLSLTTFGRKKRIKLINGTLHPSEECAKKMKNIFKERMDPEGHCWKTITPETKEFYWDEFQVTERYKALMCNVRKGKSKVIVPNSTMQKWKEAWSSPEFKAKSHQFTANRCSEIGGVGAGISRHTGGSVSHATHADRMDAFLALKEQSSQPQEGCSDPPIVDEVALYYQVVGGEKKNRVYGIGSQASIFYPSSSHGSSSTASYCAQSEAMEEEIQQLHQTIATLKDSLVAMEERDRQRELMLEERYRQREQTLEERMQQMMQNMMAQMMQGTQFTAPTPHATHQDDGREADSVDE